VILPLSSLIGLAFAGTEQIAAHAELGMSSNLGNTRTGALPPGSLENTKSSLGLSMTYMLFDLCVMESGGG
jgi:hypothetical protein